MYCSDMTSLCCRWPQVGMEDIVLYSVGALAVRGVRRAVFGRSTHERLSEEVSWFQCSEGRHEVLHLAVSCYRRQASGASKALRLAGTVAEVSMPACR